MSGFDPLAAADPRRSAWVSANAGAGKTYTLANRVSRLLLDGAAPEKILCLTYTKAAAAEMQGRLFQQLGTWSMLDDAALSAAITEIGAPPRGEEGLREARRLFAKALETPGGLKIQTIHAFCQHLLARFPLEADIPPAFDVLDEQTARDLIAEARQRVLERAGSGDAALAGAVTHLITQTSEARLRQILDAALGNDRRKLEQFLDTLAPGTDAFRDSIRNAHGAGDADAFEIAEEFCAALKEEEDALRHAAQAMMRGTKTDQKRGEALLAALHAEEAMGFFDGICGALLTAARQPFKALVTKTLEKAEPALEPYLRGIEARLLEAEERRRAAHAASLAEAALTLCEAVHRDYAREKRMRGVLDYDDLIAKTLALLEKQEAAAWVLYKMDGGLDHILIDEAQDTSPAQWKIVRALTEEFFAGLGAGDTRVRTVFAVGDEKQSIFSFQGADPKAFAVNRRHFTERTKGDAFGFADVRLATSRRSAPEILTFVDTVFADPLAREGLTSDGAAVAHSAHRALAKGRVEFWPSVKPADAPDPDPWHPVDRPSEASPVARLAEQVARRIKGWTDGRTRLPGHEHAIRPGDIMILLPRREPFASEIIRRLKDHGVPVAGADRLKIGNQIAVMDLMALARFVLLPEDDLNLAALLRSPLIDLSEEELFALAHGRKGHLWSELQRRSAEFAAAHAFLHDMRARADFAPPYEFFAHVLTVLGMRTRFLARLGGEAKDALDEFLALALAYEAQSPPSLQGFVHWIERGDAEIKRDMERGRNEVRVMTVHGAKGLEADIVILPDTTALPEDPGRHGDLLYTEDGAVYPVADAQAPAKVRAAKEAAKAERLKEHRRLLYVALTRAKDRLYVCGFEARKGVREGSWYQLAERAAQALGQPIQRGDDTLLVHGEADIEAVPAAAKDIAPRAEIPSFAHTLPLREVERPRLIRPSLAAGEDEPAPRSNGAIRFQRGLLAHALLARLPGVESDTRRRIALTFLKVRGLDDAEAAALADETLAVLDDAQFAEVFAAEARAEVSIVADLPEIGDGARVSGRIDRLAVREDHVLAVDFKTGAPPDGDVPALYATQMALYRAALAKIFPGRRIACALVWTEGPALMELPEARLDAEIARIAARLASA